MNDWIVPDLIRIAPHIGALSTTRRGGTSTGPYDDGAGGGGLNLGLHVNDDPEAVRRNRALLRAVLPAYPAWLTQVHGARVLDAATVTERTDPPQADASIATEPGVVCAVQTADCLPVLFCDLQGRTVGAAHAGWRGLAQGVLQQTVARMRDAGAGDIVAWLGPAIGPTCFEVGADVHEAFTRKNPAAQTAFVARVGQPGKYLANIYQLARLALEQSGVRQVWGGDWCTMRDASRFYSYRRDGTTGRMASLIWLK